ncbi:MAG TPA: alpha/beta hydrolase [Anaerolineales bacterium]|nr:alpha/beta hydrolase [Anaerolineales bacterium]
MSKSQASAGYFRNGLPYNRMGNGPRTLVVFQGTVFENKPLSPLLNWVYNSTYQPLEGDFTIYSVLRKPNLPAGYTMKNMADDYATMIREEFGESVDVIGLSSGGSIALYFAADHPELVRKLIIHSGAYTLSDSSRRIQMQVASLARQRKWMAAYVAQLSPGIKSRLVVWIGAFVAVLSSAPKDPSDLVVATEAEDRHNFKDRLAEIQATTLVVAGTEDPFFSETLFRETAEGIPNARLILYKGMGHPAHGKQFGRDVLMFLKEK